MRTPPLIAIAALIIPALTLAGCEKPKAPEVKPIRPVLSTVVSQSTVGGLALAGSVQPRTQTAFAFRVLGRLTARPVNTGDLVAADQILAAVDPIALKFAVQVAAAELTNAEAQFVNALGVEGRQSQLLRTGATTQAQVDAAQQALAAAQAGVTRAQSSLAKARQQLTYATLKSDFAGVVTSVSGEVGQTVALGQTIVTVAEPGARDAVIDVPDALARALKVGGVFTVALQLDPAIKVNGVAREIAPEADAATRTRRVKIALDNPPDTFRLGSTITASLASKVKSVFRLPASAIIDKPDGAYVWIVDPNTLTVSTRKVTASKPADGEVEVADGLEASMRVITAGVHSLAEGQKVRVENVRVEAETSR